MDIKIIEDCVILCTSVVIAAIVGKKSKTKPAFRVNPYLKERKSKGRFPMDFKDMMNNNSVFKENFHMSQDSFGEIFKRVEPYLRPKKQTRPLDQISPLQKFAVVMEFLASGTIQRHVASVYRISKQHFGTILDEVCSAICKALVNEIPELNESEFIRISNEFNALWNLPNNKRT